MSWSLLCCSCSNDVVLVLVKRAKLCFISKRFFTIKVLRKRWIFTINTTIEKSWKWTWWNCKTHQISEGTNSEKLNYRPQEIKLEATKILKDKKKKTSLSLRCCTNTITRLKSKSAQLSFISKTLQLTPKQSRWMKQVRGKICPDSEGRRKHGSCRKEGQETDFWLQGKEFE